MHTVMETGGLVVVRFPHTCQSSQFMFEQGIEPPMLSDGSNERALMLTKYCKIHNCCNLFCHDAKISGYILSQNIKGNPEVQDMSQKSVKFSCFNVSYYRQRR